MIHVASTLAVISAIILAAWLMCGFMIRRTSVRDLTWRTTLLLVALTPLVTLSRPAVVNWQWSLPIWPVAEASISRGESPPIEESARKADRAEVSRTLIPQSLTVPVPEQPFVNEPIENEPVEKVNSTVSLAAPSKASPPVTPSQPAWSWMLITSIVWASGAMLQLWMIGRSIRKTAHLRRSSAMVDDHASLELLQQCARQVGLKRTPQLSTSSKVASPVVIGLFRPQILIPPDLLGDSNRHDLRAVLLHECGHVQRHDLFYEVLLRSVLAALWFHPLVYVLAVGLRRTREEMCDNFVLAGDTAVNYAETLLRVASNQRLNEALLLGIGVVSRTHRLERRVASILSPQRHVETRPSRGSRILVSGLALAFIIVGLLVRISPIAAAPPAKKTSQQNADAARESNNAPPQEDPHKRATEQLFAKLEQHPIEITFRLVDSQGRPVVGASVRPAGLLFANGGFFPSEKNFWTSVESDAEGNVRFPLPTQVLRQLLDVKSGIGGSRTIEKFLADSEQAPSNILKKLDIEKISLRIDHPDHPLWWDYLELRPNARVELADSYTLIVRTRREGETEPARRVVPWLTGSRSTNWSEDDGVITYRRIDLTTAGRRPLLRVVQIPEQGPAWFSDVVDLTHLTGKRIELNLILHPGVRVEGRLAKNVPRPVRQGRLLGEIIHLLADDAHGSTWSIAADIAEDGSFVLDSVPADETLQLMALCDGWSSLPSTQDEIKAYQAKYHFPREQTGPASACQVLPRLIHIGDADIRNLAVPMQPTTSCEITVVDAHDRPISGIQLKFFPNQVFWHWGSTSLGSTMDSMTVFRDQLIRGNRENKPVSTEDERFTAETDEQGKATITGLPCAPPDAPERNQLAMFFAASERYVAKSAVMDELPQIMQTPFLGVKLKPGRLTQLTLQMALRSASATAGESGVSDTNSPEPSPSDKLEIAGRVEDERGNPIEGVKVLCGGEDCFHIRTDAQGKFRYRFDDAWLEGEETPSVPLNFVKEGYAPAFREVRIGARDLKIQLKRNTWFEGIVRKPDGTPAANVPVTAYYEVYSQNPNSFFGLTLKTDTTTDAAGRYRLYVQPAEHVIAAGNATAGVAWLPRNVSEAPGERTKLLILSQEHQSLDIQLKPSVRFVAEFINRSTGKPVPDTYLFLNDNPAYGTQAGDRHKSDANGRLILSQLPAGRHRVQINAGEYLRCFSDAAVTSQENATRGYTPINQGLTFDFQPGMNPVRIYLELGVEVSGVVVDPQGKPVPKAQVYLGNDASASPAKPTSRYSHRTDDRGRFQFRLPASGERPYHLVARDRYQSGERQWADGVSRPFVAQVNHPVHDIEIRLNNPGVIRGRTVDQLGKPLAAVVVQASALDRLDDPNSIPTVTSARDGSFELHGLRPGRYRLHGKSGDKKDASIEGLTPQADVKSGETTVVGDVAIPIEVPEK